MNQPPSRIILPALATLSAAGSLAAGSWSALNDFSFSNNPNGVWSYGFTRTMGGSYAALGSAVSNVCGNANNAGWLRTGSDAPIVTANPSHADEPCLYFKNPANVVGMHPGSDNSYADVRFTAPVPGGNGYAGDTTGLSASITNDTASAPEPGSAWLLDSFVALFTARRSGMTSRLRRRWTE